MKDKYSMTTEENIFWAKRNIVDYIWKSALLEGINVTFPQTYSIVEKAKVADVDVEDILKITNLKHAWEYTFQTLDAPLDLEYICRLHSDIARDEALSWGKLRTGAVGIGGTDYMPPIPTVESANEILSSVSNLESNTEKCIELMLKLMKAQLFWDGNKRVSMLAVNHEMIKNGCGVISVPKDRLQDFNEILCDYYSNDTLEKAKQFVYDFCISGIDIPKD